MTERIGKYQVVRQIGSGGMADVFLVRGLGPGGFATQLCLKKIRKEYQERPDFIKSFESEARIISKMHHPNIIQVFEFDRYKDERYLVMEYVDGLDLRTVLTAVANQHLQVPLDFVVYVMDSLFSALEHAHSHCIKGRPVPVIHRDISPHNILISTDGVVKLADFGIAKAKGISSTTQTGVIKGKLSYLSPEQIKGNGISVGPATDLFSAGIVMWECITSERLFKATMEHQVVAKVLSFSDASLPFMSDRFNQFLSGLLANDPAARFVNASAAQRALRKIGIEPFQQSDAAQLIRGLKRMLDRNIEPEMSSRTEDISSATTKVNPVPPQKSESDTSHPSQIGTRIDIPPQHPVARYRFTLSKLVALVIVIICLVFLVVYVQSTKPESHSNDRITEPSHQPPSDSAPSSKQNVLEIPSPKKQTPVTRPTIRGVAASSAEKEGKKDEVDLGNTILDTDNTKKLAPPNKEEKARKRNRKAHHKSETSNKDKEAKTSSDSTLRGLQTKGADFIGPSQ